MSAIAMGRRIKVARNAATRAPIVTKWPTCAFETVGDTSAIFAEEMKYGIIKESMHGCGSVAVSTVGCGPAGPGSSPGHGPKSYAT